MFDFKEILLLLNSFYVCVTQEIWLENVPWLQTAIFLELRYVKKEREISRLEVERNYLWTCIESWHRIVVRRVHARSLRVDSTQVPTMKVYYVSTTRRVKFLDLLLTEGEDFEDSMRSRSVFVTASNDFRFEVWAYHRDTSLEISNLEDLVLSVTRRWFEDSWVDFEECVWDVS